MRSPINQPIGFPGVAPATIPARAARKFVWAAVALAAAGLVLGGCSTTGELGTPSVQQLSTAHYAPTQTVDVLTAPPTAPYESLARLQVGDPTGVASRSQLVAQLSDQARQLGANALVIETSSRAAGGQVAFNPAGGQLQGSDDASGPLSITALAIRYTH